MVTTQTPAKTKRAAAKGYRRGYYRGIRLVKPAMPPHTPLEQIRQAVEAAFAAKADEIARIK